MLGDISLSIFANLRILKAQLLALRSFGIDPRTTPAHRKYVMFVRLAKYTALYVLGELVIHTAFTVRARPPTAAQNTHTHTHTHRWTGHQSLTSCADPSRATPPRHAPCNERRATTTTGFGSLCWCIS